MICPICEFEGEAGPVGDTGARETMECPGCGGTSRHRAVMAAIERVIPHAKAQRRKGLMERIAVYQVGEDILTSFLHDWVKWLVVSELTERKGAVVADLEGLRFEDESFNVVICSDVLEHVRLYDLALSELARVLKPDGALILTAPLTAGPYHLSFCQIWDESDVLSDKWSPAVPIHADPLSKDGCRVFRYYAVPQLVRELKAVGLTAELTPADIPEYAVLNCIVFICRKTAVALKGEGRE